MDEYPVNLTAAILPELVFKQRNFPLSALCKKAPIGLKSLVLQISKLGGLGAALLYSVGIVAESQDTPFACATLIESFDDQGKVYLVK